MEPRAGQIKNDLVLVKNSEESSTAATEEPRPRILPYEEDARKRATNFYKRRRTVCKKIQELAEMSNTRAVLFIIREKGKRPMAQVFDSGGNYKSFLADIKQWIGNQSLDDISASFDFTESNDTDAKTTDGKGNNTSIVEIPENLLKNPKKLGNI